MRRAGLLRLAAMATAPGSKDERRSPSRAKRHANISLESKRDYRSAGEAEESFVCRVALLKKE